MYQAARIRLIERAVCDIYETDVIQSPLHLSIGQEAVAVGVCGSLRASDLLFATYRSHSWYLAKGGEELGFFAELMGKRSGICKGKGGSMHLADARVGMMGTSAIVAGTISHAVGSALGLVSQGASDRVCVSVFGEGALDQGAYHESLNFAVLKHLPVIFVMEDNGFAVHHATIERQAFGAREHAGSYGVETHDLSDTRNPDAIQMQMKAIVEKCRETRLPQWVRIETYRYMEHVGVSEDFSFGYRDKDVFLAWLSRDPIEKLIKDDDSRIKGMREEISTLMTKAAEAPFPTRSDLYEDV
jgi:pyruvate dehydrogenase E1 component alpha subunit